jgi:hypothetical protein
MAAGSTYEPIATTTLSSATSSVTFSSISGSYTDLILVFEGTSSAVDSLFARVNSDTASNYSATEFRGDGSTPGASRFSNISYLYLGYNVSMDSTNRANAIIHFMNYSNSTTYKTVLSRFNRAGGSSYPGTAVYVNLWRSTSAITSIQMIDYGGGSFSVGSTFTLYGIAAA